MRGRELPWYARFVLQNSCLSDNGYSTVCPCKTHPLALCASLSSNATQRRLTDAATPSRVNVLVPLSRRFLKRFFDRFSEDTQPAGRCMLWLLQKQNRVAGSFPGARAHPRPRPPPLSPLTLPARPHTKLRHKHATNRNTRAPMNAAVLFGRISPGCCGSRARAQRRG